jgi:hypothetical protein
MTFGGDIARRDDSFLTCFFHPSSGIFRVVNFIKKRYKNISAFASKGDRDCLADSGICAGDESHLALQSAVSFI